MSGILAVLRAAVRRLLRWSAVVALVVAAGDYAYKRYEHEAELRMTRQEFLDELKQDQGNPQVKRAIRRAQQKAWKRVRGMHQAATATVVLTNPTHYRGGIALSPRLRSRAAGGGQGRGRRRPAHHCHRPPGRGPGDGEQTPGPRAVHGCTEVGDHIPRQFYRAIAEVLTLIMRSQAQVEGQASKVA